MNHLLADDSHEISSLYWFLEIAAKLKIIVSGALRVMSVTGSHISIDSINDNV